MAQGKMRVTTSVDGQRTVHPDRTGVAFIPTGKPTLLPSVQPLESLEHDIARFAGKHK
jgi:hypothetical protein